MDRNLDEHKERDLHRRWERIAAPYENRVRRIFARLGFDADEIDDLTQETKLKCYRNFEKIKSDVCSYLHAVASSVANDYLTYKIPRKLINFPIPEPEVECSNGWGGNDAALGGPEEVIVRIARQQIIYEVLRDMDKTDRTILILKYYQDLSFREIATELRKSEDAVTMAATRARGRLRERLQQRGITNVDL